MVSWYLVGGALRDLLSGGIPRDLDFVFTGGVEAFVQAMPKARKVGRSVDVWLVGNTEFRPLQGENIQDDLRARDLTINSMAVDEQGRWFGHPQAITDLQNKVLRPAAPDSFRRDPARVYRLARMAAAMPDFFVHEEALRQMRDLSGQAELAGLPAERVCHELLRALAAPRPSRFLDTLNRGGCLSPWFAELEHSDLVPAGPLPWHNNSVLEHTGEVMDRVTGDPLAVWMALCHDLGKMTTATSLFPHHYGHDARGVLLVRALSGRLGVPRKFLKAGELTARLHMKAGQYLHQRPGARRDTLWDVHVAHVHGPFWRVVGADSGCDFFPLVDVELAVILNVRLPDAWKGRGEESGQHLRALQCQALPPHLV